VLEKPKWNSLFSGLCETLEPASLKEMGGEELLRDARYLKLERVVVGVVDDVV
jgi:hypothetical protein